MDATMDTAMETGMETAKGTAAGRGPHDGPLMRAFVGFNLFFHRKPPTGIDKSAGKVFVNASVWAYRRSQGRVMGRFGGLDGLLLRTLGRKTGKDRVVPLGYRFDNGIFYVAALPLHFDVPGGPEPALPAWYRNLLAVPEATIDIGQERIEVVAETVGDDERERIWPGFAEAFPFFGEFQNRVSRPIPVVRLTPKDAVAPAM